MDKVPCPSWPIPKLAITVFNSNESLIVAKSYGINDSSKAWDISSTDLVVRPPRIDYKSLT